MRSEQSLPNCSTIEPALAARQQCHPGKRGHCRPAGLGCGWREQKRMHLATDHAEASDLAAIVDRLCLAQHPHAIGGDQVVKVTHRTGRIDNEGSLASVAKWV